MTRTAFKDLPDHSGKALEGALTPRQRHLLRLIAERVLAGRPPTVRELNRLTGISSPNGIVCHLEPLESKGLIRREDNQARGITLVGASLSLAYEEGPEGERLRQALEGAADE